MCKIFLKDCLPQVASGCLPLWRDVSPFPGHLVPGGEKPPAGGHLPPLGSLHRVRRAVPAGVPAARGEGRLQGAAQ